MTFIICCLKNSGEKSLVTKEFLINFEKEIAEIFETGSIKAPVHLANGNEDQLISIFKDIKDDDWVFSTHRNHYHALLHNVDPELIKKEIINGNSITFNSVKDRFLTSAIVCGIVPVAVGAAMACKINNSNRKVWVFVGDMASEMGTFHEAVKYSERNDLPITFIIEDNGKSVNTPTSKAWGEEKTESKVIKYTYTSKLPHQGIGKWVTF